MIETALKQEVLKEVRERDKENLKPKRDLDIQPLNESMIEIDALIVRITQRRDQNRIRKRGHAIVKEMMFKSEKVSPPDQEIQPLNVSMREIETLLRAIIQVPDRNHIQILDQDLVKILHEIVNRIVITLVIKEVNRDLSNLHTKDHSRSQITITGLHHVPVLNVAQQNINHQNLDKTEYNF